MRVSRVQFLLTVAIALPAWCAKQPIVETDLLKIGRVTEVQVTPEGASAVFAVQTIHTDPPTAANADPVYSYRTNIWMVDLRDPAAKPVQLTFGARKDSELAISPDGSELAFVRIENEPATPDAKPDKKQKPHPQVWILPLSTPGEARAVTHLAYGAMDPRWRSDGKALLVSSEIPISKLPGKPTFDLERPGRDWWDFDRPQEEPPGSQTKTAKSTSGSPDGDLRSIRDWLEHDADRDDPTVITRIAFLDELSLNGEMTFSELYRVDLGREPKTTQLTATYRNHRQGVFSPDGRRILFAAEPPSHLHPDRLNGKSAIWEVNADGSDERTLLSDQKYSYREVQFTKDGKHLLLVGQQNDQPTYRQAMLAVCDPDGSRLNWITKDGDPSVQHPEISDDGHAYYTLEYHGGQPLRRVDLKTHRVEDAVNGPMGVNAFAIAPGKVVYAQISVDNPNELYVAPEPGKGEAIRPRARRLTDINARWLEEKVLSLPEEHWITRPDGVRVEYWVMKPTNAQAGKRYPWVLDIHGGPSAMWGPGEFTMWHEFQIFCSFGYGVVYSNPRGSGGYGYDFQHANYKNWGDGPMGDLMAVVDDTQTKYPMVDTDREFVTGGSYAGYMTAWIVGHTQRFKAAAALRGVYDLSTFFGEGNAFRLVPEEFGGYPWQPDTRKLLDHESPITYVENMHTPLLIIHGSQDNRTGIAQSQMLFRALKQLDRPVEYVRYPGIGHELTRSGPPQQRMDHMLRIIEFFERYSQNASSIPAVQAGAGR